MAQELVELREEGIEFVANGLVVILLITCGKTQERKEPSFSAATADIDKHSSVRLSVLSGHKPKKRNCLTQKSKNG